MRAADNHDMWRCQVRRRRGGSRLFAVYALASLVPVALLGAVLVRGDQHAGLDRGLSQGRAQAAVIEQMAVAPALDGRNLASGLSFTEVTRLRQATDLAIFSGSVSRLRLRSFSGRVIFSDDGTTTDALATTSPAFRTAAAGGVDVAVVRGAGGGSGGQIRVLQPVVPNASGQATGVLELYLPYGPIAARVRAQLHETYRHLVAGLAALYLVLGVISWSTTRRLSRHAAEREHQALHDPLTGLANREWFRLRLEAALRGAERSDAGAVVLVDLDRFKQVNDTLGHHAGDELLRIVAHRLTAALRTDDTVARLGGDEFGLLLPALGDGEHAVELLSRVRDELATEVELDGMTLTIEASFGVATYPEHGASVEELLQHADAAMYHGKRGATSIVVYQPSVESPSTSWLSVYTELRRALGADELRLYYQPKVDLVTGVTTGVEALLRWQHPERGLLTPDTFLPAAEQSGLIEPLTTWVLRRALADHASWTAQGASWTVSVNVSARNLECPGFADRVTSALALAGVPAAQLTLEVTETALTADTAAATATLADLAAAGVTVSIDDFGIGYTSLSQLRSLPVGEIKIDRAFVSGIAEHDKDRSIVAAMIDLAHSLGCTVTAEGVETAEVAEWLRAAGCEQAQGYFFAKPAPWHTHVAAASSTAPTRQHDFAHRLEEQPA